MNKSDPNANAITNLPSNTDVRWIQMVKPEEEEKKKVKEPTIWPCIECDKPTRSHIIRKGIAMCHSCYMKRSPEDIEQIWKTFGGKLDDKVQERNADSAGPGQG